MIPKLILFGPHKILTIIGHPLCTFLTNVKTPQSQINNATVSKYKTNALNVAMVTDVIKNMNYFNFILRQAFHWEH